MGSNSQPPKYAHGCNTNLRQRSSFVREDIIYLSKFFIEGGSACLGPDPCLPVEHQVIPVDVPAVAETNNFNTEKPVS